MSQVETKDQQIEELQDRVRLLELMIDTLSDRLFIKDRQSCFLYANATVVEAHGLSDRESLIGTSDFDHQAYEQASQFFADEQQIMESGKSLMGNVELNYDEDGNEIWFSTDKIIYYDDDEVAGIVGLGRNITKLKQMESQLNEQEQLIDGQRKALQEVSTPILPIFDRILVMPLIGTIDSQRASNIMRQLLSSISNHRAKIIILDITGVPLIDTGVADYLHRTIQAARLKGAQTIITGVSDAVAETLVDLGIDWSSVETKRDLQSGLITALEQLDTEFANDGTLVF